MRLPVMPPVSPMLAKSVASIPPGASYEPKWDGFRSIYFRDMDEVELGSRNERPRSGRRAPSSARSIGKLSAQRHREFVPNRTCRRTLDGGEVRTESGRRMPSRRRCPVRRRPPEHEDGATIVVGDTHQKSAPFAGLCGSQTIGVMDSSTPSRALP